MSFTPKPSQATKLWIGILVVVLLALFVETRGPGHGGYNFFLSTDSSAEGASIYVDGQKVGTITSAGKSGMSGGAFWGHLTGGKHVLQVQKPHFRTFNANIDMHGEEYLGVELQRSTD